MESFLTDIENDIISNDLQEFSELYQIVNIDEIHDINDFISYILYHSKIYVLLKLYFDIKNDNISLSLDECLLSAIKQYIKNNKTDSLYEYSYSKSSNNFIMNMFPIKSGFNLFIDFNYEDYYTAKYILSFEIWILSTERTSLNISSTIPLYYVDFTINKNLTPESILDNIKTCLYKQLNSIISTYYDNSFTNFITHYEFL